MTLDEKLSGKARFQSLFGLPVRPDAPLIYLEDAAISVSRVAGMLTRDLQIALRQPESDAEAFEKLSADYPDRLAILPAGIDPVGVIAACDFGVFVADSFCARLALSSGTVPICTETALDAPVDFSPELDNGNCFVFGEPSGRSFDEVLGTAMGAFTLPVFKQMPARLPGQAISLNRVAEIYQTLLSHPAGI
jgi:hypothetical protein